MSISMTQRYTKPSDGNEAEATITVDVKRARLDATTGDTETFVLVGNASGKTEFKVDVSEIIQDVLDGKSSRTIDGETDTYVTAQIVSGNTIFSVFSTTGFAVGDPICVRDTYDSVEADVDYAIITAITGSAITVSTDATGTGLGRAFQVGAIVQNLKGRHWGASTGLGGVAGLKAQLERPEAPASVTTRAGGPSSSLDILWHESSSTGVVKYYDIYASRARLNTGIPANRFPIYLDFVYSGSFVNLTQYNEADNVAYTLQSGRKFYIYVVAKTGSGHFDNDESAATEKHYNVP